MAKVIIKVENNLVANILGIIFENEQSDILEVLKSKIIEYNKSGEGDEILSEVSEFMIEYDNSGHDVEHIITLK